MQINTNNASVYVNFAPQSYNLCTDTQKEKCRKREKNVEKERKIEKSTPTDRKKRKQQVCKPGSVLYRIRCEICVPK